MSTTRAFTLIELLIAIALGAMIVAAAAAGLRVASQALTVASRLARENALMRTGVDLAHDEVDYWTSYDDPDRADGDRPLKRVADVTGLCFQPFAATFPRRGDGPPTAAVDALADGDEDAAGWDGSWSAFAAANPRSWQRCNPAEKELTDLRYGRYAIVSADVDRLESGDFASLPGSSGGGDAPRIGYGPVAPPHRWLPRQIAGLTQALGYFGLLDYLPANALYAYYGAHRGDTNAGGMPLWAIQPTNDAHAFTNGDGWQRTPRGKYRNSYATSYAIVDPSAPAIAGDQHALFAELRRWWALGYGADADAQADFNAKTAVARDPLPLAPSAWPTLRVSVQRFIKNARQATVCRVRWASPVTGESAELPFATIGTTLRGARQQRRPDRGWARWDDDGVDRSRDAAYRTLDSY